jgi:hypothetical protein
MGSLVAVRLYQKIKDSLRLEIEGVRFFTDSSAVLGMLNKDSGTFLEFQPVESWPVKKDFTPPPIEECRKDVTQATCAVAQVVGERLTYPSKASSRAKLVRIFGYVMMAVAAFKRQPWGTALIKTETSGGKRKPGPPPEMLSGSRPGLPGGGCAKEHGSGRDGQPGSRRNHSGT